MLAANAETREEVHKIIRNDHAFHELSDKNKNYFADHATLISGPKKTQLWKRRSKPKGIFYLVSGFVEISHYHLEGEENIMGFFGPGDMVGITPFLKKNKYGSDASFIASKNKALLIHLDQAEFEAIITDRLNLLEWQNSQLIKNEDYLKQKILVQSSGDIQQRITALFEYLALRFSAKTTEKNQHKFIPIPLTKTQIAKFVGARVETVIRILRSWERAKQLEICTNGIYINLHKFNRKNPGH